MDYNIKRLSDYSDESLLNELRMVAKKLGKDTMTYKEFKAAGGRVSVHVIAKRFGSWNAGLKKAGLSVHRRSGISVEELFAAIDELWSRLGRQPKYGEMRRMGRFASIYERRFGTWVAALEQFVKWKNKGQENINANSEGIVPDISPNQPQRSRISKRIEYGEPIEFLGLRHAPLNEQGVVYLFGMLSRKLGFIIEAVRTDFPDCEGKRQIPGKQGRWERVAIEFEYKSSNFKEHGHNPDECDVIVCWEHDWKDCPVEVISLKELMGKIKE